ncbi:MAG: hypothetical protein HY842_15975 [Bacteroidetes bacterium]|nr:hypothetical protein [Bacteroidota bacterium]
MKLSSVVLVSLLIAGAFGCKQVDEFQDADIVSGDAEFAIPLLKAKTSIQDLLENFDEFTFIEIDPDGVIHLRYKGDVLSQNAKEFFDDTRSKLPPLIPLGTPFFTLPFSSPGQLEVDFATYSTGTVSLALISDYVGMVDLTVQILQAKKNGQPMTVHTQFQSPIGIQPIVFHYPPEFVECAGYDLIPENGEVHIRYDAVTDAGDTIELPFIALVNQNIDFSYIEGYLGNFEQLGKRDSITIEFFENWTQGDVFFEDPVIKIYIDNSFGVPTRSSIDTFDILTVNDGRIPLESDFITETGIDFVYPALNEVGQTKSMTFTFDASNSNIKDVLGSRPIALDYKVDAIMNPDSIVDQRGFITDSSFYRIQVEVDLPLHGRANGFGVVDSFDVDFSGYGNLKEVEFKLVADNNMPLAIDAQVYFVDTTGTVLDSLFDARTRIVEAAPVDSNGEVTDPISRTNFSTFTTERFDKIRDAKKLVLHGFFSTTNDGQQSVKAFANQDVEIRMGMKLKR